jgi:hypothetical protein
MTDTTDRKMPGEREYQLEPQPPPVLDDDETSPSRVRSDAPILSVADHAWIRLLDPAHLDAGDVSQLRQLRNRAGSRDERRLLDRLLRVPDAARAEADRRAPIEHELRTVENMLKLPEMSHGRTLIIQQRAEAVVRDSIADAVREAEADYARDPRQLATILATGAPNNIVRQEAEREHRARVAGIHAARDDLMTSTVIDVERAWRAEWRAKQIELAGRKQELQAQLAPQNGNGTGGS